MLLGFKRILVCYLILKQTQLFYIYIYIAAVDLIQQGMSEKVGIVVNFLGAFISGFILAYVREWRLALAMTSILPLIMFFGMMMNKFVVGYKQ